ncbi:MAG: hypothetical protein J7L96_06980, partial [Bacteroidales bacterium]|nr:hypothetical protein [Bacteroidales bacterium]
MNSFLSNVARDLINTYGTDISDLTVLFPNRRSVRMFSHELSSLIDKPVWAPDLYSINDWIHSLSTLDQASELDQSIYLYTSLKKNWEKAGSYSEFSSWGQMLQRDFDEIDKYLLDPHEVFSFLSDEKEIEARFTMLEKEEIRHLQSFWSSLRDKPSDLQREWLGLWKVLATVHNDFTALLGADKMATEGAMYRHAAELARENPDLVFKGRKVVFVGFNALTRAEEVMLEEAHRQQIARFYWDSPPYLLRDDNLSGSLIRGYIKKFKAPDSFGKLIASAPNRLDQSGNTDFQPIETYSFDSSISQTKIISDWLKDWSADEKYNTESRKTGIILGEEDLLNDLLQAYSSDLPAIDSSIGYPLINSEVTVLIRQESINKFNNHLPDKNL